MELDLPQDGGPDGSEADLNHSGDVRRLRGSPANSVVQETRHETDARSIESTGRKLQSTTQVCHFACQQALASKMFPPGSIQYLEAN